MDNTEKMNGQAQGQGNQNDCGCEGNCCPPKKKSILPKIIFSIVILAALGIIVVKLFFQPAPAPAANRQVFRDPNTPVCCDSTASKTCDTIKGSSCCPK